MLISCASVGAQRGCEGPLAPALAPLPSLSSLCGRDLLKPDAFVHGLQILFGYALSMLLLHELESRSRAYFLRKRGRTAQPRMASGTCLGALTIPVFFLLSAVISWELVENFWEVKDAMAGALTGL